MKNQIWKWCGIWILSWCLCPLFAQSEIETKALALFDAPVTWVKHYSGLVDGTHSASLCLAFDGFNCKGYVTYDSGATEYLLEGSLQSSHLVLLEKYNNEPSGYIEGDIITDGIQLNWIAMDEKSSYEALFKNEGSVSEGLESQIVIMNGLLDDQSVQLILQRNQTHTSGNLIFKNGMPAEKLYSVENSAGYELQNISAGYKINLVNTKENQFVASFMLPGANAASQLELTLDDKISTRNSEYLSHTTKSSISLPVISPSVDKQIDEMTIGWINDMTAHQSLKSKERFCYTSKVWFEIEDYSSNYVSGILHYSNSWGDKVRSKSFTYDKSQESMVKVASFLKGSAKWENMIKQQMIAAKTMNDNSDQDTYENWINKVSLIEPILCEDGLQFYTEPNSVFGQAKTFMPWDSLSPMVISTSKLNKLRKVK